MKIIYTFVKLKLKEGKKNDCDFCGSFFNKIEATYLLRVSDLDINKTIDISYTCDDCKERIENKEIDKCADCGRLKKPLTKKCLCVHVRENNLTFEVNCEDSGDEYSPLELERQINTLNEEKEQLAKEINIHLDALQTSEIWHKKQKQELLDKITDLEKENKVYKEENKKLKTQLEQLISQQTTQIEVLSKDSNKIKHFFKSVLPK